jgi:hypothetical protein
MRALGRGKPEIHQSDQGVQYAATAYLFLIVPGTDRMRFIQWVRDIRRRHHRRSSALPGSIGGQSTREPIVRALLDGAVRRLQLFCVTLLYRSYPRLTQSPLNAQAHELLGAMAERLLKAQCEAHPQDVRQLFALTAIMRASVRLP